MNLRGMTLGMHKQTFVSIKEQLHRSLSHVRQQRRVGARLDDPPVDEDVHAVGGEGAEDALVVGDEEDAHLRPVLAHLVDALGDDVARVGVVGVHEPRARHVRDDERALQGGGPERIEQQHKRGKLTARERVDLSMNFDQFRRLKYGYYTEHAHEIEVRPGALEAWRIFAEHGLRVWDSIWVAGWRRETS